MSNAFGVFGVPFSQRSLSTCGGKLAIFVRVFLQQPSKLFSSDWPTNFDWIGHGFGTTGETLEGWVSHLLADVPPVIQGENVIESKSEKHWSACESAMRKAGYLVACFVLNSRDYSAHKSSSDPVTHCTFACMGMCRVI